MTGLAVLLVDQVTKTLAVQRLAMHSVHVLGPLWFRLEYNSGVAFSIGTGATSLIVVIDVVLVAVVAFLARKAPTTGAAVATGLVLGGAVGNLGDRLVRGHHGEVVDFLYTRYWPTFNVADASVVCGCALLALTLWRSSSPATGHDGEDHSVATGSKP
jgi:signal peptidase II